MQLRIATALAAVSASLLVSCSGEDGIVPLSRDELAIGIWGGANVGVIVDDSLAHVHVGCTLGNFPRPTEIDDAGRFSVAGEYLLRAYPVAVGPTLPALFNGTLRGDDMTLTVSVNDTIEKKTVTLGPVTLRFKRDPQLGPCPICRTPKPMATRR